MKNLQQLLILGLCLFSSVTAQANLDQSFNQARSAFTAYVTEQGGSFDAAWEQFTQLDKQYPNHPAVQMYFGSLETIKARDAWMPWSKMKWVEQGLDRMDRALTLIEPEHEQQKLGNSIIAFDIRLVAANTFLSVPSFLNRLQDAKDVFADLLDSPNLEQQPTLLQQEIYIIGVKIAEQEENAEALAKWQRKLKQLKL